MKDAFISNLRQKLQQPLPGRQAQYKMAHAVRQTDVSIPSYAQKAGVMALFYPKLEEWHIALIQRVSNNKNDRHSGQISFPGGRYDPEDASLEQTAIRETQEEIGVDPRQIRVLGPLTNLYIPVSNFLVMPYVGFTDHKPDFIPQESEVAHVLEVPFRVLQDPSTIQKMPMHFGPNITLKDVPYYNVFGKVVWGATAMMLSELVEVINK